MERSSVPPFCQVRSASSSIARDEVCLYLFAQPVLRQMTSDTGPFDAQVATSAISVLLDRVGPAILVTHSQSGGLGWMTVIRNSKVRAVVSFEPGSGFVFPEGEAPPPMPSAAGPLEASSVPLDDLALGEDSDRHLLRGQHPTAADGEPRSGQLARASCNGEALGRCHQSSRRRCHAHSPARDRDSWQHPLPVLRSEQPADRGSRITVPGKEGPRLTPSRNARGAAGPAWAHPDRGTGLLCRV